MRPADDGAQLSDITGANSPLILDPDVDSQLQESDFRFFDDAVAHTSPTSASRLFDEFFSSPADHDFVKSTSSPTATGHPLKQTLLQPQPDTSHLRPPYSGSHSNSPDTSSQGSSVASSSQLDPTVSNPFVLIKRKPTDMAGHNSTMDWTTTDGMQNGDDPLFGLDDTALPTLDPMTDPLSNEPDFTLSNQAMANDFDFDSAGSSPSPFGLAMPTNTSVRSNPSTTMAFTSPGIDSPATQTKSASPVSYPDL